ncbi:hypothetical protein PV783_11685 [Chitinophaga sp. CC14]|uniref:hypothetical protein n=1 Tax=Chitinophaga sp. CC14 TaxID=3029199 RepID=UPI003B79A601
MRWLLIFLIVLTGCITERGARHYATDHPEKFADFCGTYYPVVSGPIPEYRPANNTNYLTALDSLIWTGDDLTARFKMDSARAADSISRACADLVTGYARQVDSLSAKIKSLRSWYKPCWPDTVPAPYPVLDNAKLNAANRKIAELSQDNQTLKAQIAGQKTANNRQNWYCYLFGILTIPGVWGLFKLIKVFI